MRVSIDFRALGTRGTVVGGGDPFPTLDAKMASVLVEPFNTMGIRIMPNTTVSRVARADGRLQPTVELITAVEQTNRWTNASR